jgi:hypothetical protein
MIIELINIIIISKQITVIFDSLCSVAVDQGPEQRESKT